MLLYSASCSNPLSHYLTFRERLASTGSVSDASRQTKVLLSLQEHHGDIQGTLISLGQYSQAINAIGAGQYTVVGSQSVDVYDGLLNGCSDLAGADLFLRKRIGKSVSESASNEDVISPLVDSVLRAANSDARGAVVEAGNAVESYLTELAARLSVNVSTDHGINAKVSKIAAQHGNVIPPKLTNVSKYLGHIRNAADHGIDPD